MREPEPDHWLYRLTPRQWVRAALRELAQAEGAFAMHDRKGGMTGCRRAAGMSLNAPLCAMPEPEPRYGRTYLEHLEALCTDERAPAAVREAALQLHATPLPGASLVALRTSHSEQQLLEATRTVLAHALALVLKSEPEPAD